METLLRQLRELGAKLKALPRSVLIGGGLAVALAVSVALWANGATDSYQYAFTNLTAEDSAEAAAALKVAGIPMRLEAGGTALAVPASKVYDARLILASAGLPRGGGVGFELFDKGDLGVTEFTQRINLRRAIEGELARTISKLSGVRSARVHLSLAEKGLFRGDERKASAAVVLNLQPGRALGEKELAGIRHLVASAVPALLVDNVTVVDGKGSVLTASAAWDDPSSDYQRKLEKDLEQRVVSLLEPVVGAGAVIAKVTATLDASQQTTQAEVFDPDGQVLRSERRTAQSQSQDSTSPGGVAGAVANVPLQPVNTTPQNQTRGNSNSQDEVKNYEITKTTTTSTARLPRLQRLSVAVLLDGKDGKPRADPEVARLAELARSAVGFDEARGDQLHVSSAPFTAVAADAVAEAKPSPLPFPAWMLGVAAAVVLGVVAGLAFALRGRKKKPRLPELKLMPGAKVSDIEAQALSVSELGALPNAEPPKALPDPAIATRDRARELALADPSRVVKLIRAWLTADAEASHG